LRARRSVPGDLRNRGSYFPQCSNLLISDDYFVGLRHSPEPFTAPPQAHCRCQSRRCAASLDFASINRRTFCADTRGILWICTLEGEFPAAPNPSKSPTADQRLATRIATDAASPLYSFRYAPTGSTSTSAIELLRIRKLDCEPARFVVPTAKAKKPRHGSYRSSPQVWSQVSHRPNSLAAESILSLVARFASVVITTLFVYLRVRAADAANACPISAIRSHNIFGKLFLPDWARRSE